MDKSAETQARKKYVDNLHGGGVEYSRDFHVGVFLSLKYNLDNNLQRKGKLSWKKSKSV